jgi:hypothetical protein
MKASTVFCCSTRTAALGQLRRLAGEELLEDLRENLVLAQHLVDRRALVEAQQSELRRFGHHRGVRRNLLVGRRPYEGGDLAKELRDVVQQLVRRKHIAPVHRQQAVEALEPQLRQRGMIGRKARRELVDRRGEVRTGHRRSRRAPGAARKALSGRAWSTPPSYVDRRWPRGLRVACAGEVRSPSRA